MVKSRSMSKKKVHPDSQGLVQYNFLTDKHDKYVRIEGAREHGRIKMPQAQCRVRDGQSGRFRGQTGVVFWEVGYCTFSNLRKD